MSLTSFCQSPSEPPNPSMYESIPQLRNQVKVQLQRRCIQSTEYHSYGSYGKTYRKHLHSVQSEVGIDSTGCTGILNTTYTPRGYKFLLCTREIPESLQHLTILADFLSSAPPDFKKLQQLLGKGSPRHCRLGSQRSNDCPKPFASTLPSPSGFLNSEAWR